MDWYNVLKVKQILTPTTDINIKKVPKKKKDKNCNEKLKAYADKIQNLDITTKYDSVGGSLSGKAPESYFKTYGYPREKISRFMRARWIYEPIPEIIACAALEQLDKLKHRWGDWDIENPSLNNLKDMLDETEQEWVIRTEWVHNRRSLETTETGIFFLQIYKADLSSLFGPSQVTLSVEFKCSIHQQPYEIPNILGILDKKINWRDN
tara:strand:- start:1284 stop:1907 length:624 start_codon:yes stop_codon:yes gene_type:complete